MNLKMSFMLLTVMLLNLPTIAQANARIHLSKGLNSIDLNGDGISDAVFSATYDNNTSHPNETLNIFIRQGQTWLIVPVPDDDGFTWTDLKLSASALKVGCIELHRYQGKVYLVRAVKFVESSDDGDLTDKTRVKFSRFRLEESNDDPGTPAFYWGAAGVYSTEHTFETVDEAFQTLDMERFR
ncbi:Uncharacterised protein [Serratia marcescens]|uniref:carbapenem self-resistance protein CarG family protein n=1 Tax=Serratia TaxID=613 RepID=UPI0021793E68|nr:MULTISPECIES: CpmJ protein [Serratia]CAI1827011.1 Uncharacterised protein [Serratia marcescens]